MGELTNTKDKIHGIPYFAKFESKKFSDLDYKYNMKCKYKDTGVIYLWQNINTNQCYIGSSSNFYNRLSNYLSPYYLNHNKYKMPICKALLENPSDFNLYILYHFLPANPSPLSRRHLPLGDSHLSNQRFDRDWSNRWFDKRFERHLPLASTKGRFTDSHWSRARIYEREDYFVKLINPSYNVAAVIDPFKGKNHPRFGKTVSIDIKNKISKTLTGRVRSDDIIENHRKGAHRLKKIVKCFTSPLSIQDKTNFLLDKHLPLASTKGRFTDSHLENVNTNFVCEFESMRYMARTLNVTRSYVERRVNKEIPFKCFYNGVENIWFIYTKSTK